MNIFVAGDQFVPVLQFTSVKVEFGIVHLVHNTSDDDIIVILS